MQKRTTKGLLIMRSTDNISYDPTDMRIASVAKFGLNDIDITEITNESSVRLILDQHLGNLYDLKATKEDLVKSKGELSSLRLERESLRVQLAESASSAGVDLASILVSLLGGFAINMLTTDRSNALGWVILILCVAIILVFKVQVLKRAVSSIRRSEGER
jgi:hypothetical protein